MQVVIDIPEESYEKYKRIGDMNDTLFEAIRKGIVLPKGHGDLIDRDELEPNCVWDVSYNCYTAYDGWQVENATVVIPADKDGD